MEKETVAVAQGVEHLHSQFDKSHRHGAGSRFAPLRSPGRTPTARLRSVSY
jgi:hypothetical protein